MQKAKAPQGVNVFNPRMREERIKTKAVRSWAAQTPAKGDEIQGAKRSNWKHQFPCRQINDITPHLSDSYTRGGPSVKQGLALITPLRRR